MSFARGLVRLEIIGESLFKLQRNAFAHYAYRINGVHKSIHLRLKQVAMAIRNHRNIK